MGRNNYYEILGVSKSATTEEITAAKNALAKKYHPDANMRDGIDTTEIMQSILEAYGVLSNEEKRKEYDKELFGEKVSTSTMQTFDLSDVNEDDTSEEPDVLRCWKASGELYETMKEAEAIWSRKQEKAGKHRALSALATKALHSILVLRTAEVPEQYWHPVVMNKILFQWYQNRNYTIQYMLTLYEESLKKDTKLKERSKIKKTTKNYCRSIHKLLKE